MKKSSGFTVIELVVVIVFALLAVGLFFVQRQNFVEARNDQAKKTAINAMYYSLEEVYYAQQGHYPTTLDPATLPSVDPELFKDPSGVAIGESASSYRYEPTNCANGRCENYTLRASLNGESDFIRESNR